MIKNKKYNARLATLLLAVCSLFLLAGCQQEEQAPDMTAGRPTLNILFVGNESTFLNHMPYMVQLMAQTDPTAHFKIDLQMHVTQSASLAQLWHNPATRDILTSKSWDYIIIQPHNMWAATEGSVYLTRKSISAWSSQIKQVKAQPVLFMTWPLEPSHSAYTDPNNPALKNYKNMHRLIRGYSKALAQEMDLIVSPIGDYWMAASMTAPEIELYSPDRSSPSLAGSYFTALVLYKTLVNISLDNVTYIPEGITPEAKDKMINIVSRKIK